MDEYLVFIFRHHFATTILQELSIFQWPPYNQNILQRGNFYKGIKLFGEKILALFVFTEQSY